MRSEERFVRIVPSGAPFRGAPNGRARASARDSIPKPARLSPHILTNARKRTGTDGTKIVSAGPTERELRRHTVAVGQPRTRALQALNQPGDINAGIQPQKGMD